MDFRPNHYPCYYAETKHVGTISYAVHFVKLVAKDNKYSKVQKSISVVLLMPLKAKQSHVCRLLVGENWEDCLSRRGMERKCMKIIAEDI